MFGQKRESSLQQTLNELNKAFNFDWNDYRTIEANKNSIDQIESIIAKANASFHVLNEQEKKTLGQLCYKLATFYNHVNRTPHPAVEKLLIATKILTGNELRWTYNHIAFSYQQMLAAAKRENNNEKIAEYYDLAITYCDDLINRFQNDNLNKMTIVATAANPQLFLESNKIVAFAYCVKALTEYERDRLDRAIFNYAFALSLYEFYNLIDDQYARAKNRYAQFLIEKGNYAEANKIIAELDKYWSEKKDDINPYLQRFYEVKERLKNIEAFNLILVNIENQLSSLPFAAREVIIESLSTLLLRSFVPMSGMTVQQHVPAYPEYLDQLNQLTNKKDAYKNSTDARYVYQFAREATSGGIIPAYRDNKTGEIFIALVCNARNLKMYNLSAGYTEAPLPGWRGKLLSEKKEVYFDRAKIKDSATKTMMTLLEEAGGDFTKIDLDYKRFQAGFESDGITSPMDIDSLHTATRECFEEIHLDLNQFPQRKTFLISTNNTVGISQGDAPGQTSNRNHQYLVFLGNLDNAPEIKPGDDVAIAEWINVSNIVRKSNIEYLANNKPLCIYLLRGLELGLKDLWNYFLEQASSFKSQYSDKVIARFSTPENLLAEIESFCVKNKINIEKTSIISFMQCLAGNLPNKTHTGREAQQLLNCMLETVNYLLSPGLNPVNFLAYMDTILLPLQSSPKIYSKSVGMCHFRPVTPPPTTPITIPKVLSSLHKI